MSRETILKAINFEETEKVPVDLGGHRSSGIHVSAYKNLRRYLGFEEKTLYMYDVPQQLAIIDDDVLEYFGVDTISVGAGFKRHDGYWSDFTLSDGTVCKVPAFINMRKKGMDGYELIGSSGQTIGEKRESCLYFEQTLYPMDLSSDFTKLDLYFGDSMWHMAGTPPAPADFHQPKGSSVFRDEADYLRDRHDRALIGVFGGNLLETGTYCFGMEDFLVNMMVEPKKMHDYLDELMKVHLSNLEAYLKAVGDKIDVIVFGDDLGSQHSTIISKPMYREFFKERHSILWNRAKELCPHLKVNLHSCGNIYSLLDDLIDAGLDIVNPVQISCPDMKLKDLKAEFGSDLTFWGGGADTHHYLRAAESNELKEHVLENLEIMTKGGGFVFQQVHNIQGDTDPKRIVAMFEAIRTFENR